MKESALPAPTTHPPTTSGKPRDAQVCPLAAGTLAVRSRSWDRLRFEIEYALERGTTANAYVIQGDKVALIDPPGASFTEIFLTELQTLSVNSAQAYQPLWRRLWSQLQWVTQQGVDMTQLGFDLNQLDFLILGHVNPNRIETLKALIQRVPHLTLVCSNPAATILQDALPDHDLNLRVIRSSAEATLDLGQGHELQFLRTPTPRWPDSLWTYDPCTRILFTDKFFGAHVCGDEVFDLDSIQLGEDQRYYFDCLMAPHTRQVATALEKLMSLSVDIYAPAHGPILYQGVQDLTHHYRHWNKQQRTQTLMVALLYASAYGNTTTIGQAIARGITKAGVQVESINCEMADLTEIEAVAAKCDGFIIGSPTLGGHAPTQIQTALGILLSTVPKDKPVGVFGSFGWSGEAIDLLRSKLRDAGYRFGFDPIKVKFKPTDVTLKTCEEAGTDFAQGLKKVQKVQARRQGTAKLVAQISPTEQAVGRIVGSLCVVTARQGEVSSAMLASWVSQATFNPPGLTVAVAKDRAVETLLHTQSPFVLNVLAEDNYLGLMKHFLKPFKPGEDRFTGVATATAENGCPILEDALSYVECEVGNRMECGDHWLVYGVVKRGKVLRSDVKTAVHQRKSGSNY